MTKEQFKRQLNILLPRVTESILRSADRMLGSGCVDLERYSDDFELPHLFLCAAFSEEIYQFTPINIDRRQKKEIKNIELFL